MSHLLNVWPAVSARLHDADRVLLLFDYDGTLTPIVPTPSEAVLYPETRRLLAELSQRDRYLVGVISGRSLRDIKSLVSISGLVYAGNHGLEISGRDIEFTHPGVEKSAHALGHVHLILSEALADVPWLTVEHKGLSLTVHFRGTPDLYGETIDNTVVDISRPFIESGDLKITRGKKVVEVRPNLDWGKGKAIDRIRKSYPDSPFPVFFGDDQTDEDGFVVVQDQGGVAVYVGPARTPTAALHQVESPGEVSAVLKLLLGL